MSEYKEIRFSGTGGQGVILAAVILAEAAARQGFHVVQTQAYGPESRGGATKAEVIIARKPIHYPEVRRPSLFLAMSQEGCRKYLGDLTDDSILVTDSFFVREVGPTPARIHPLPFTQIAKERLGSEIVANIVALGAVQPLAGLVGFEVLADAVRRRVPPKTIELNMRALESGRDALRQGGALRALS